MSSLDNECADLLEPVGDIQLLGGVDARHGYIGARVERLAVRLTVSTLPQCTPSLCGEGWDIAILRIRSTCTLDPTNVPCIPPIRFGTTAATLSREVVTVGHGDWPGFDRREEWHLDLEASLSHSRFARMPHSIFPILNLPPDSSSSQYNKQEKGDHVRRLGTARLFLIRSLYTHFPHMSHPIFPIMIYR